eukprot:CAMPEP_0169070730 /NCGR_PEP_ID=MMETSP1015-20121227/5273_1 /TAXON_ID=342587 /ORGANISM="Karlodinium micrum, Strain CCMP2283" /LENGTH=279 /DNA_ID=CAMNT_0009129751 /DNA_START=107 /DNA_END=946 /DNA_ORIENTATION=+
MEAFDTLEHLQEASGASYAEEYMRLRNRAREAFVSTPGLMEQFKRPRSDSDPEIAWSRSLDKSRRRILHFLGKLVMYNTWGYLTAEMMHEFPGKARAMHAISLLQPLVSHTSIQFGFEEHQRILDGIRNIYQIAKVEQAADVSPAPVLDEYTVKLSSYPRGELYMAIGGTMRPVCGHWFWDVSEGPIIACKALGYSSGVSHRTKHRLRTNAVYVGGCREGDTLSNCTGAIREINDCKRYSVGCGQCAMGESSGLEIECIKDNDECSIANSACSDKDAGR